MTPSTHDLTDAEALTAALAAGARERSGDHPELDQLADYLAGALAPAVEAGIQDHLVACRACTTRLLDLESLSEPGPPTAEGVADLAVAAGWREQKSRIADLEAARRRQRALRWASAVAASFFVATVGLSVHVGQLRQRIAGLEAPEVNVPTINLDASTLRSSGGVGSIDLRAHHRSVELRLDPVGFEHFPEYEVEILDASGSTIWRGAGLGLDDLGILRLRIPLAFLPSEELEIQLYGHTDGHRERLGTFPIPPLRVGAPW